MISRRNFLGSVGTLAAGTIVGTSAANAAKLEPLYVFDAKKRRWVKNKNSRFHKRLSSSGQTNRRPLRSVKKKSSKKEFEIDPKYLPQNVSYNSRHKTGTIVVDTRAKFLYLVTGFGTARRYGVGVGRQALEWSGTAKVGRKAEWPTWTPTANMIKREPEKYLKYKDGLEGGPNNPLGSRALYLYKGKRDTYYRIHGTTAPWTIGTARSNGCIRMVNDHVVDLYARVPIGTTVVVL
ncbi:MAG: L,D-transpeptidase [Nitratireductor sp.]